MAHAAKTGTGDVDALLAETLTDGRTVGENVDSWPRSSARSSSSPRWSCSADGRQVATYLHRKASDLPPQVGVLVQFEGDDPEAARGAAMQVAAMRPQYVSRDEVPADVVENERRVAEAKTREEGKPEQAMPKIVEGRVNAFFKDVALLEQESVRDSKKTVKAVLDAAGVTVTRFARFEVGGS